MHLSVTVKEFPGQLLHPPEPEVGLYFPGVHAKQPTPSPPSRTLAGTKYPAKHEQLMMKVEALSAVSVFAGHIVQLSGPDTGLYVPAKHAEQLAPSAPV